ncbi:LOW QUALITY PROTEIN: hypothetical protein PHMEG_00026895 [Phytophthora megakarya]|uniref:Retrotransposon gag domain-containing protein n=1 Tax=Phytophthora megakarya TaxID=4795 RepID=A0A225V864_9STRA|nr:LOW QUALITY PROTEIN: hypothetical protein PHMEG_00026895 [Phytophthora megakarya]
MEETNAQTLGDVFAAITHQQTDFQTMMQRQFTQIEARIDALTSRFSAPQPNHGKLSEDLELWFFAIGQFYADFHPLMTEESSLFAIMISCHLGSTPMNWYRQLSLECDATDTTKS